MLRICELMHWDYWTYIEQPQWFIDALLDKFEIDFKRNN